MMECPLEHQVIHWSTSNFENLNSDPVTDLASWHLAGNPMKHHSIHRDEDIILYIGDIATQTPMYLSHSTKSGLMSRGAERLHANEFIITVSTLSAFVARVLRM